MLVMPQQALLQHRSDRLHFLRDCVLKHQQVERLARDWLLRSQWAMKRLQQDRHSLANTWKQMTALMVLLRHAEVCEGLVWSCAH